jgi:hypothetical protein
MFFPQSLHREIDIAERTPNVKFVNLYSDEALVSSHTDIFPVVYSVRHTGQNGP